ncbi:MAG: YkgJ family cysteine cluster protein [Eubacteriales bacterium]|nr:YkgJ family cysteine cluster protein [Eubacteriales bacterium]
MIRECSLEDISDGKLYGENDMVKADTNGCSGCKSVCCHGMGDTIKLDPYDIYRLTTGLNTTFEQLMNSKIELNVVDGVIMPNLKMTEGKNQCSFLNDSKRCDIHGMRPGICRLFPLGRYWEDETHFKYILQTGQCHKDNLTKIKVKKWLDTQDLTVYNQFIAAWHKYLKDIQAAIAGFADKDLADEKIRILNMYTLKTFYITPYTEGVDFYKQFYVRLDEARKKLGMEA